MKSKTMILMILAIGCGLVASILTSRMLAQNNQAEVEKVSVLVAKQKIALGTAIKEPEKLFVTKQFIKGEEPKGAITKFEELKDKRLNKPINPEVHVTPEDFEDEATSGLQGVIRPGYRAIAIKVAADTNVAGFVRPHSRVDVISTVRGSEQNSISRIILENMLVLAVDQMNTRDGEKVAHVASTVTLEAKPDEAEKLAMAGAMGELRLVLRNNEDEDPSGTRGARPSDVVRGKAGGDAKTEEEGKTETAGPVVAPKVPDVPVAPAPTPEPPKVVAVPPPPKTHTLTVYNGESVTRAVYVVGKENEENGTEITRSEPGIPAKKPEPPTPTPTEPSPPPAAEPKADKAPDGSDA